LLKQIKKKDYYAKGGTENKFIESIIKNGLSRRNRKHIHFVNDIEQDKIISGYKKKSNVKIIIDMKKCMENGIKFYRSSNNVILSEGINGIIDSQYFIDIEDI
jgi:2'-phosphotransferase